MEGRAYVSSPRLVMLVMGTCHPFSFERWPLVAIHGWWAVVARCGGGGWLLSVVVVIRFRSEGSGVDEQGGWDRCNVRFEYVIAVVDVHLDDVWHCNLRLLLRFLGPNT